MKKSGLWAKWGLGLIVGMGLFSGAAAWGASVENVRAQQRTRSRVVDVWYDLVSEDGGVFEVSLWIAGGGDEPPLSTVGGDIGANIEPGRNKRIEWNAGTDWPGHLQENFVATVTAKRMDEPDTGPSEGMVRIPGGTNSWDAPPMGPYSWTMESFYMDRTEVTYAHWKRVYNWALAHGYQFDHPGEGKGANHPVHTVNLADCMKWCNARSEMEGRTPAYTLEGGAVYRSGEESPSVDLDGEGYRCPTWPEWQYAARGGLRGRRFPWGDVISHGRANYWGYSEEYSYDMSSGFHPKFNDDDPPFTSPVGSFAANAYGLFDMAGNVREWITSGSGSYERLCGGSWFHDADECQCGSPGGHSPILHLEASYETGFRTVRRK